MRALLLLSYLALVCVVVVATTVQYNPISDGAIVHIRGGAKGNSKRNALGNSKVNKGKKVKAKYGKTAKRHKKGPGLRDKLEKLAKQGQSMYNDVYRRAKVLRSSAFEAMLLKATWPSDEPVQPEILGEIIKYSIPAFKFASEESEDDPYTMTLHKLWTKMYETDWRTVVKSLYILHTILRDSQSDACRKFGAAIKDMAKTRNPKNPDHKYFDIKTIGELDEASATPEIQSYVTAYASYVIFRSKSFTARFDEVKNIDAKSSEKKVLAVLKKAQRCIELGLDAQVRSKKEASAITGYVTKQVAADLRDLFALYGEKISRFTAGGTYANPSANNKAAIADALKFYQSVEPQVKACLKDSAKLFARLRIKIPTELERRSSGPSADAVAARIKELTTITGGASGTGKSAEGSTGTGKKVLHRADRPLTPEEAQASVDLAAAASVRRLSGAVSVACSGESACGGARSVSHVLQHSAGAKFSDEDEEADDVDDNEEEDDEEFEYDAEGADGEGEEHEADDDDRDVDEGDEADYADGLEDDDIDGGEEEGGGESDDDGGDGEGYGYDGEDEPLDVGDDVDGDEDAAAEGEFEEEEDEAEDDEDDY